MKKENEKSKEDLLKIIPLDKDMDYGEIAKLVGNNLNDVMFDRISPYRGKDKIDFNAISIKRSENHLIINFCKYEDFSS